MNMIYLNKQLALLILALATINVQAQNILIVTGKQIGRAHV